MKKLLLLGGSRYILPVIEIAHKLDCYVITCDYLPDNIAHKFSDEYLNISIIDKEAVLKVAEEIGIDGIMSFACDPGVVTASYVAEKMGLPFQCSYESAKILQDKGLFRQFLTENGFNAPHARRYTDINAPFSDIDFFTWPVIVKPVDSAGSKSITKAETPEDLGKAIETALNGSHSSAFVIEDYLTFEGYHSSTDAFVVDGKLKFITYSDHMFDKDAENPYTPTIIIWSSTMKQEYQDYLTAETQRLIDLLRLDTGIYNIETCVGSDGKPYLMEISPRGGGGKIADLQDMAFNTNLVENEIRKAVGMPLTEIKQTECNGYWCKMVIHARAGKTGIFNHMEIDSEIREKYIKLIDTDIRKGDMVYSFTGANRALGDMFLKFSSREELNNIIEKENEWLIIKLNL
ncbi:MAG: ATP-grasp domain-containing protein [Ruminococcus sp.]|nr:ATP-grasp domain-containing protein [Ruminococcus sp.]